MIIKTKKNKLETGTFIKVALKNVLKDQWWVFLIALALMIPTFFVDTVWFIIGTMIALVIYFLFWLIQFAGVTQLEQTKMLFEKLSYEISSKEIMIKLNARQGMPVKWENVKRVVQGKDHYALILSKVQIIYLPHRVFNSTHDIKFFEEAILKRKGLIK
ncbi:MAG: YcxB family protein [Cyclobacteriaceae bacterium]|nr:YcxB family protein [Cyclobacteriaceae bacterium]MCH8515911.1 YcxB family protein [Cyclobacteriaceae bacterium]